MMLLISESFRKNQVSLLYFIEVQFTLVIKALFQFGFCHTFGEVSLWRCYCRCKPTRLVRKVHTLPPATVLALPFDCNLSKSNPIDHWRRLILTLYCAFCQSNWLLLLLLIRKHRHHAPRILLLRLRAETKLLRRWYCIKAPVACELVIVPLSAPQLLIILNSCIFNLFFEALLVKASRTALCSNCIVNGQILRTLCWDSERTVALGGWILMLPVTGPLLLHKLIVLPILVAQLAVAQNIHWVVV